MRGISTSAAVVSCLTAAGTFSADIAAPASAQAQSAAALSADAVMPDDIVVTAQKRSERLQDVPISITAIGAATLQDRNVTDVLSLSGVAPGLQVKIGDSNANPKIFLRGVGLNDFAPNTASAVGIYVDGVYITSPLAQLGQFFDVQQVEVLRGPQGTLYGKNTTGGAINITTRIPTSNFAADGYIRYGRFNTLNLEGGVGGPIAGDVLKFRLAGIYVNSDGFIHDRVSGRNGPKTDNLNLRGTLAFDPSSDWHASLQLKYGQSRGGSILTGYRSILPQTAASTGSDGFCKRDFYYSGQCTDVLGYSKTSKNLYDNAYSELPKDRLTTYGVALTATRSFGDIQAISISSYDHAKRDDFEETDANPLQLINARYQAAQETYSEEVRLQNSGSSAFRWLVGAYAAHDVITNDSYYNILAALRDRTPDNPSGADLANSIGVFNWRFRQRTTSLAAFGQIDYELLDRLTLTAGLRYSSDKKTYDYVSSGEFGAVTFFTLDEAKLFSAVSGRIGVKYDISPDANVYASYNRGFKSGGFPGSQATDPGDLAPYKNETINAYEIGIKSQLFDRKLTLNADVFYYDYRDLQVFTYVVRNNITVQNFTNASNARIYGGEAELTYAASKRIALNVGISLLHARYQDFKSVQADYSGNRLPSSPSFSATYSASYTLPLAGGDKGGLRFLVDGTARTKVFFDTRNVERLSDPSRVFVDLALSWTSPAETYEAGVTVRNVTKETDIVDIIPIEGLGFDNIVLGKPRTYAAYLRYKF